MQFLQGRAKGGEAQAVSVYNMSGWRHVDTDSVGPNEGQEDRLVIDLFCIIFVRNVINRK